MRCHLARLTSLAPLPTAQLQRHSDHHANALREYQILRSFPESPQLPTGYAGMCVLAVVPPLWRWVMDHRVLAYYKGA